jgi:hypothetical protein
VAEEVELYELAARLIGHIHMHSSRCRVDKVNLDSGRKIGKAEADRPALALYS